MGSPFRSYKRPPADALEAAARLAATQRATPPATPLELAGRALDFAEGCMQLSKALVDSHLRGRVIDRAAATTARNAIADDARFFQQLTTALERMHGEGSHG